MFLISFLNIPLTSCLNWKVIPLRCLPCKLQLSQMETVSSYTPWTSRQWVALGVLHCPSQFSSGAQPQHFTNPPRSQMTSLLPNLWIFLCLHFTWSLPAGKIQLTMTLKAGASKLKINLNLAKLIQLCKV